MATNLFKNDAQRLRDRKDFWDGIISVLVLLAFVAAVCYLGYRLGNYPDVTQQKISQH